MNRPGRALVAAAVVAVAAIPTVAHADTQHIQVNAGSGWVHDSAAPLFDVSRMAPGWSQSRIVEVRNNTDDVATLALNATDIVDDENACNRPEATVDVTCGAGEGEVGHELLLSAFLDADDDGTFDSTAAWTGTLYDLSTPVVVSKEMPAHGVVTMRIDAQLPFASGNETQTDQVGFRLRLSLEGTGSAAEVEGTKHVRERDVTGDLPFTGSPASRLVAAAIWMLLAGLLLLLASRYGRTKQRN